MPEPEQVAPETARKPVMRKQRVIKEDGRYLIFYTWEPEDSTSPTQPVDDTPAADERT